jgi:uncharacterized tellurite resistance protein B-like protein
MRGSAVELLEDCPSCRLEAGLVETYDARVAACRFGVPARASCKLCGLSKVGRLSVATSLDLSTVPANRCPACRELLRPEALDVRVCGACGVRAGLEDEWAPVDLTSFAAFQECLSRWAERESFADSEALVLGMFVAADARALHATYLRGEPLETVADPFAFGGRAGGSSGAHTSESSPTSSKKSVAPPKVRLVPSTDEAPSTLRIPGAPPVPTSALHSQEPTPAPPNVAGPKSVATPQTTEQEPPMSAPPRAILYPLVSVISADGEIHASERAFVDAFLVSEGMAPLSDHELRVYTPAEAARYVPKERREKIVELMCEVAMVDGLADDAEVRVVRAYASAWQVPEEKVETWLWGYEHAQASAARQFWLRIRRFVLSSRWENQDP